MTQLFLLALELKCNRVLITKSCVDLHVRVALHFYIFHFDNMSSVTFIDSGEDVYIVPYVFI